MRLQIKDYALLPLTVQRGIQSRTDAGKAGQIVNPEPHLNLIAVGGELPFPLQLASEPPGDADVTEVIDDATEDIPVKWGQGAGHGSGFQMQKNRCAG